MELGIWVLQKRLERVSSVGAEINKNIPRLILIGVGTAAGLWQLSGRLSGACAVGSTLGRGHLGSVIAMDIVGRTHITAPKGNEEQCHRRRNCNRREMASFGNHDGYCIQSSCALWLKELGETGRQEVTRARERRREQGTPQA